jgi:hypothetical protein
MKVTARTNRMLAAGCALTLCVTQIGMRAAAQERTFVVHGTHKSCSDITQLDSVLTSSDRAYFAGWSERDYADAITWSEACKDYGWHIVGKPRIALLKEQHDRALPPPPAAPVALVNASANDSDPLLADDYYNAHFHEESLRVAAQAHLDIGQDPGASNWVSAGSAAQLRNRLTADKIVMFCAHRSPSGATEVRPLLWDWRRCEALEAAAYKRLVTDNEFPAAGRGILLGCAGLDSYLYLEHCIENLSPGPRH